MIEIRGYLDKDREATERVCIETAGKRASEDPEYGEMILNMYHRYYTSKAKEYCFVPVNERDEALGYIVCAPDTREYIKGYMRDEVAAVRRFSLAKSAISLAGVFSGIPFMRKYPAHLHIDLTESCRGQGVGSRLVAELCEKLRADGIPGVMLIVAAGNTSAIGFYNKNGFRRIIGGKSGVVMGKELI